LFALKRLSATRKYTRCFDRVNLTWSPGGCSVFKLQRGSLALEKEYLPEHKWRFRHTSAQRGDYQSSGSADRGPWNWRKVFHQKRGRVIGNDWVVRRDNRYFQVKAQDRNYALAKGKVTACESQRGDYKIRYRRRAMVWEEIPGPVAVPAARSLEVKT
jgi:hypothetical protein